jgi:hypothetical protein
MGKKAGEPQMANKTMNMCGQCKSDMKTMAGYPCNGCRYTPVASPQCLDAKTATDCKLIELRDKCTKVRDAVQTILEKEYRYEIEGTGNGQGQTWWCRWVAVNIKCKECGKKIDEYALTFRLDNYPQSHSISGNNGEGCLYKTNCHEIKYMGYIQFVENINPSGDKEFWTPSFKPPRTFNVSKDEKRWYLSGEDLPKKVVDEAKKVNQEAIIGEVKPLKWDDTNNRITPFNKDNAGNPIAVKWRPKNRPIRVNDFFFDNAGKPTNEPDKDRVKTLANAFIEWIGEVEKKRGRPHP